MPLSISVWLRDGRYDAAFPAGRGEWPPHPARVFSALLASAEHDPTADGYVADNAALRWLENAGPPLVMACAVEQVEVSVRSGFMVSNQTDRSGGSTAWPGRTNRRSVRHGSLPSDDRVAFVWPDAQPDDGTLWRLHRLARRIPYLGRSTSVVEVAVHDELPEERPSWMVYRPTGLDSVGDLLTLRVPYPGFTDALREAYADGERAWERSLSIPYTTGAGDQAVPDDRAAQGPYRELVVWPMEAGRVPVDGERLLTVTEILRAAVIGRVDEPVPAAVSGHGADGRPHVAYLPLLDVGHRHARGHLLGVGVAVPDALPADDRLALLRGLLGPTGEDPIRELRAGRQGMFALADPADPPPGWGTRPDRWTGGAGGRRRWMSVTPVMFDRYPGRRDPADVLADAFVTAGYPRPASVTLLEAPIVRGSVRLPRRGTVPAGRPRRPFVHCMVEFPAPVRGPVIAGSLRYLGCGLFVPEVSDADG